jgi:hypothetical protein
MNVGDNRNLNQYYTLTKLNDIANPNLAHINTTHLINKSVHQHAPKLAQRQCSQAEHAYSKDAPHLLITA